MGYDSYAESRRYIRKFNKRITRRGLPTATYSAADPYTLIFKENTYSPELISEVSSLFISTLAKQRRQIQLVLPNTGELESRYHMLNQKGSVDFVDFLNHVGKERFETDPVYLETLGDGKELGSFYKEYLRAKIKKHSYSLADLTVRGDVTDMLQKIKVDRGINGLSRPHITNTGGYGPINQLNKIKIHYSPEANLPSGGNLEFFKLVNQRGLPKLIVMGQPQKNLILGVGQNPYGELFSQTPALGFWGNQSSGVGHAYSNAKVSP